MEFLLRQFADVHDDASIQLDVLAGGDPVAYNERRWVPAFAGTTEKGVSRN
jgi:hypothetical protein